MSSTETTATHSSTATAAALPYHEPTIATVLTQASLLLALNALNSAFDKLAYCGLLGQIALGITWGTPGVKWLDDTIESTIVQLGYLGLILMVYEGGLSTSLSALKANFWLSSGVALTGIALPISFSFALKTLLNATSLQCFAAGAALCSTSLGTTFTLLRSSGLAHTRLGVILTSAAMLDDVIGLVMVQVISSLGQSSSPDGGLSVSDVLRPILVSIGFALLAPAVCIWAVKPLTIHVNSYRQKQDIPRLIKETLGSREAAVMVHTLVLLGLVAGAGYAGTSVLYAAYIAGVCVTWWDTEFPCPETRAQMEAGQRQDNGVVERHSGLQAYEIYYSGAVNRVLRPFFFASIGFSIPITEMFSGTVVWKGVVYSILMVLGKVACGLWLVRVSLPHTFCRLFSAFKNTTRYQMKRLRSLSTCLSPKVEKPDAIVVDANAQASSHLQAGNPSQKDQSSVTAHMGEEQETSREGIERSERDGPSHRHTSPAGQRPLSLYPASLLGCGMVARGEIGFLISSLAESQGIFQSSHMDAPDESESSSQIFLVITWAVVLCTIVGPLAVGLLAQRLRRLQEGLGDSDENSGDSSVAMQADGRRQSGVLGVWGLDT